MKFLLVAIVSTVIAAPTYAACSKEDTTDCKTMESCMALNSADNKEAPKFVFESGTCLSQGLTAKKECTFTNDTKRVQAPVVKVANEGDKKQNGKDAGK